MKRDFNLLTKGAIDFIYERICTLKKWHKLRLLAVFALTIISCSALVFAGFFLTLGGLRDLFITPEVALSLGFEFSIMLVAAGGAARITIFLFFYLFTLFGEPLVRLLSMITGASRRSLYRKIRKNTRYGNFVLTVILFLFYLKMFFLPNHRDVFSFSVLFLGPIIACLIVLTGLLEGKSFAEIMARPRLRRKISSAFIFVAAAYFTMMSLSLGYQKATDRMLFSNEVLIGEDDIARSIVASNSLGILTYDRTSVDEEISDRERWVFFPWANIQEIRSSK